MENNFLPKPLQNEQNLWNFIFSVIFAVILLLMTAGLGDISARVSAVSAIDFFILALASFRLTRLFIYDKITQFVRDFFLDIEESPRGSDTTVKIKPRAGPRRTIADLLDCPWCTGVWLALFATFFYFYTPYAKFPLLVLAIAGLATLFQLFANAIGWKAENLKMEAQGKGRS